MRNRRFLNFYALVFLVLVFYFIDRITDNRVHFEDITSLGTSFIRSGVRDFTVSRVTAVIDGDTLEIDTGERVRLIGIDAPEFNYKDGPAECFSKEAKLKLNTLVINKTIKLEKDLTDKDKYERLLRYIWIDNLLVNEVLVLDGYAVANVFQPDTAYAQRLYRAQQFARIKKKGLWGKCRS